MTGFVVSDPHRFLGLKHALKFVSGYYIGNELRELESLRSQRLSTKQGLWLIVEQLVVKHPDHGGAGTGGHDYIALATVRVEQFTSHRFRVVPETVIERRLAAARLRVVKIDLYSKTSQNTNHRLAHFWVELVDDTRHEQ
jgi:hypothetical protein